MASSVCTVCSVSLVSLVSIVFPFKRFKPSFIQGAHVAPSTSRTCGASPSRPLMRATDKVSSVSSVCLVSIVMKDRRLNLPRPRHCTWGSRRPLHKQSSRSLPFSLAYASYGYERGERCTPRKRGECPSLRKGRTGGISSLYHKRFTNSQTLLKRLINCSFTS